MTDLGNFRSLDLVHYLRDQMQWSKQTFGCGTRTEPLLKHIEKEVQEVRESNGDDLYEWIDIIILAFDGALTHGFDPGEVAFALRHKLEINKKRTYEKDQDGVFLHV